MQAPQTNTGLPFELEALTGARNYQEWIFDAVEPFMGRRILEIGSGIGNMSRWLPIRERLVLTEADPGLFALLEKNIQPLKQLHPDKIRAENFALLDRPLTAFAEENIDTVVSFNVLEHIEHDTEALAALAELLRKSRSNQPRRLVTLVPAHGWAYGSLDKTFGHFRRYSAPYFRALARKVAPDAKLSMRYFNVLGLAGWIVNGKVLKKESFSFGSVQTFEKICPYVRPFDDLLHEVLGLPLGNSLIAVLEWN